ncbi:MAG: alcohol dehydrogenase catalytic domain-containing protein [Acidobacteria bacterium]|nr:alcohol dehydrogenase catalytic domain-containing protein [Acidobacteriota bacterium]
MNSPAQMPQKMPEKMKVGLYFGQQDIRVVERLVPEIGPREALAKVMACGICGSDTMKWYREPATRNGGINTGHEIAGQLVKVGSGLADWKAGDRVIITHHFPCLQCTSCLDGNETACEAMHNKHIEPGGFSQFVRILESGVAKGLYRLPETMSYEEGSFVEPLGCVVRSVRKAAPIAGRSVLVMGSGLGGLLHIKMARALGASSIAAVDTNENRLHAARQAGADPVILAGGPIPSADRVFICTGSPAASVQALQCLNRGGHMVFFAADGPDKTLSIPVTQFWFSQPTIQFSYGAAPRDMQEATEWIRSGKVRVDDLITHRFSIEQIPQAFELAANPRDNSLKIIIHPNGA